MIGTVLFHWIVEIIYAFDFRAIFAKPLHLLAILVVLFAGMLAMQFDVTGYDTWLPDRADITAVDIDNLEEAPQLTDPSNIDAVYRPVSYTHLCRASIFSCRIPIAFSCAVFTVCTTSSSIFAAVSAEQARDCLLYTSRCV